MSKEPQIIILNGASSAGKTSAAIALAPMLKILPCLLSSDIHINSLLPCNEEGNRLYTNRKSYLLNTHAETIAEIGLPLVIDTVYRPYQMIDLYRRLENFDVFSVALKPSLETVIDREKERSHNDPRDSGLAQKSFMEVYSDIEYDLIIDNSKIPPEQVARQIIQGFGATNPHKRSPQFNLQF